MKADPSRLVRAHYETLADARNGRPLVSDYLVFVGLPVAVGIYCGPIQNVKLPAVASGGLLTVAGLLSAFLFGVMLQVSERAMDWADTNPTPGKDVSRQATFLRELAANAGYASLVSVVAAGLFVVAAVTSKTVLVVFSAIGLAMILHLAAVLLMVMRRVFALTEERLKAARTGGGTGGADLRRVPRRKTG
jgi:hypothetical protein